MFYLNLHNGRKKRMIHFISPIYPGTAAGKDFAKSHEISFANEETFLKGILVK